MDQNLLNNQNLNLLNNNIYQAPFATRVRSKLVLFTKLTVIVIELVFLLVLFLEFNSNNQIKTKLLEIEAINELYVKKGFDEPKMRNLIERIEIYKALNTNKQANSYSQKLQLAISKLSPTMKIASIRSGSSKEILIEFESSGVIDISFYIDNLLKNETVEEIYIEKVDYLTGINAFNAALLIRYK